MRIFLISYATSTLLQSVSLSLVYSVNTSSSYSIVYSKVRTFRLWERPSTKRLKSLATSSSTSVKRAPIHLLLEVVDKSSDLNIVLIFSMAFKLANLAKCSDYSASMVKTESLSIASDWTLWSFNWLLMAIFGGLNSISLQHCNPTCFWNIFSFFDVFSLISSSIILACSSMFEFFSGFYTTTRLVYFLAYSWASSAWSASKRLIYRSLWRRESYRASTFFSS